MMHVNALFAFYAWVELGCPDVGTASAPVFMMLTRDGTSVNESVHGGFYPRLWILDGLLATSRGP